ncbi:MAG: hypothetical protein L3J53_01935 [Proteobacteria bacterium]|nr:hypothetical protein [Pseudomonadota bacterium]
MLRTICLIILFMLVSFATHAVMLEDYLPKDTRYDTSIPTPRAVLGTEVGHRHYRHDQIMQYLSILTAASARARLVEYGMSNEGRRLVLLFISSNKNMENLDSLANNENILKVWNGFSVHGNEASGANASILYAYHLIAGHSEKISKTLNETLIIIDPTINPDGYDRFVTDVNSNRGIIDNTDSHDLSHQEQSPNGRTNHYWFDLNRDWLLLSQVESQVRIKQFHKWQPHVLGDHHEMGSDKTFFFQPGVPDRTNPLIPQQNIELTNKLGKFHAQTLSAKGMSFYTKESYDDFFPGKGSTYPDLHGSVGILFEQASAKGGNLKAREGMRTLVDGIDNQFRTALSTLYGAYALKSELLQFKQDFFQEANNAAAKENFKGYVLDLHNNLVIGHKITDYLAIHNIQVTMLEQDVTINKHIYRAGESLFIPIQQQQYTLIKSLFATETSFKDNTFYDVSAWNLPMAWGLTYAAAKSTPKTKAISWRAAQNSYAKDTIAYAFNWNNGNAAAALNYLQQHKIITKVTTKSFSIKVNGKMLEFAAGAIIIPVEKDSNMHTIMANITEFFQVSAYALTEGLSEIGIDLGSPAITTLKQPKVLMLIGANINAYQAGSFWHMFDTQIGKALTKITQKQLNKIALHDYSHIILPSGKYKALEEKTLNKIKTWVKQGGTLIAFQQAAEWAEKNIQAQKEDDDNDKNTNNKTEDKAGDKPYASFENDLAQHTIGGAIVAANADLTHPLAFGMQQKIQYTLIKGNTILQPSANSYAAPLKATDNPLAAGYISAEKIKLLRNSSLIVADKLGKGMVIKFAFNPTFRGFWLGTQKWLINAVYFSKLIRKTELN